MSNFSGWTEMCDKRNSLTTLGVCETSKKSRKEIRKRDNLSDDEDQKNDDSKRMKQDKRAKVMNI